MNGVDVGICTRPAVGQSACGDQAVVVPCTQGVMLCLVDGLGHGPEAERAARVACAHAAAHPEVSVDLLLQEMGDALAGTRGAAVSLAVLLPAAGRLRFAGVGNVELRAIARTRIAPPTVAGIVGQRVRRARVWEYALASGDLVVLHTDGISSRFDLEPLAALGPQALADTLVASHHKAHDDAGCIVARVAP